MPETLDLRNFVENIVSSYEKRIEGISSIFDTTNILLNDFQEFILNTKEEREKINIQIRDTLAKNEHLRKKDFDNMMQGILSAQNQREKEVRDILKGYLNDQKELALSLRENLKKFRESLAKGKAQRSRGFQTLIKNILTKQEKRTEEISFKLKDFQKEQRDLAIGLKQLLAMGDKLRIRDFKLMLREFNSQREKRLALQRKGREETSKMLDSFRKARKETRFSPQQLT